MTESVEELVYRLRFYRQVKICAAFLRERLDEQPFLPGATRKNPERPGQDDHPGQLRIGEEP